MEQSAGVDRDALQEYVDYQQKRLQAISGQRPLPVVPQVDSRVRELYANIFTGMRAFWGSNEGRSGARADLFSMQLELGQPTILFTLSPDSSSSYRIANLAGEIPECVLSQMESGISEALVYSRAQLGHIAASNPYICAR